MEAKPSKPKALKVWAVDFGGTLCSGKYPNIGKPNTELIEVLKLARMSGVKLILWTSREGADLQEAVDWCSSYGLEFDAVNENLPEMLEGRGYDSRKIYASLYIDDQSFPYWGTGERGDLKSLMNRM